MKLFGLSVLKSALKVNSCFRESITSLVGSCDQTYVFIKDSFDGTEKVLEQSEYLKIYNNQEDDYIPLQEIRENCEDIANAWCLILKKDEVFDIEDAELLRKDIKRALSLGLDSICLRPLHFINDPHTIAIDENFQAHSLRAFRLGSDKYLDELDAPIGEKTYFSEAKIFNYKYLRQQKEGMFKGNIPKRTLSYLGPHPAIMKRRVENWGGIWNRVPTARVYILGERRDYRPEFIERIKAKRINWVGSIVEVPVEERPRTIILKPGNFHKIFRPSKVPMKMKARDAHDWSEEFIFLLKLSEKGIGTS